MALQNNDYREITSVKDDFKSMHQDLVNTVESQKKMIDTWKDKYFSLESKYNDALKLIASNGFCSSSSIFQSMKKHVQKGKSQPDIVIQNLEKEVDDNNKGKDSNNQIATVKKKSEDEAKHNLLLKGSGSMFALLFRKLGVSDIQKDKISHNIEDLTRRICKDMDLQYCEIALIDSEAIDQMRRIEVK